MARRFARRSLLAAIAASALLVSFTPVTSADHWGAGGWHPNTDAWCEDGTIRSECSPEDPSNWFYFDSDVPDNVKSAWRTSFTLDYDLLPEAGVNEYDSLSDFLDVRVRVYDVPDGKSFWAYTTCGVGSTHLGSGRYESCRLMVQRIDPQQAGFNSCMANNFCRHWYACHEIGHTFGLQHPGTHPSTHVSWATCMDYDDEGEGGATVLHAYDEDHLFDCFPKANQSTLTSTCSGHSN